MNHLPNALAIAHLLAVAGNEPLGVAEVGELLDLRCLSFRLPFSVFLDCLAVQSPDGNG